MVQVLSEGLVQKGHRVRVLAYASDEEGDQASQRSNSSSRIENIAGVEVQRIPHLGLLFSQPLALNYLSILEKVAQDFDLIHVHSPNPLAEAASLKLAGQKPVVVTYHSDIIRQKLLGAMYGPLLEKFLGRSQKIYVATPQHIEHSPHLPKFKDQCEVIPFGINLENIRSQLAPQKSDGGYALFVGRMIPYKGVPVLLEAVAKFNLTDFKLKLVGTGPHLEEYQSQAQDLGVQDQVEFLGAIPSSRDLYRLYQQARFFVLPSITRAEAFGMVLIESMACGTPAIATRLNSGVPFVNLDGVSGLNVDPSDANQLAEAIEKLWIDPTLRNKLGQQASARAEAEFDQKIMVARYESSLHNVLNNFKPKKES